MKRLKDRNAMLEVFPKRSVGAEVGVLKGRFSAQMLRIVKPKILYLVDCWQTKVKDNAEDLFRLLTLRRVLHSFRKQIGLAQVRLVCGMSPAVSSAIPDSKLDWVYIDADHTEEACLADLRAWYPKVKMGGIISGHDYNQPKYRNQVWGVAKAVTTFMREKNLSGLRLTMETRDCSFWFPKTRK